VVRVDNLSSYICRLFENPGSFNLLELSEVIQISPGIAFTH
jgi:hypothetical protein